MTPRARALLGAASTANIAANLLFPVLAVRALGAGSDTDALFVVFILPGVVAVLLGNSVLNWSTPRLVRRDDDASRRALCWSLLWTLLAVVLAGASVLGLAAVALRPMLEGAYALAAGVLPAGLVAVVATVAHTLAQSLYTAERDVPGAEARTFLANALATAAWVAVDPATLAACAWLFALRPVLIALVLLPRLGPPRPVDPADRDLREVLRESRLLLLAATYYKSEPFVDRLLFASVPGGAVAAFHLAQQVTGTLSLLVNRTLTAPLVAPLAARVHAGDIAGARSLLGRALRIAAVAGVVAWVVFWLAGEWLVGLMLAGGAGDPAHVVFTAQMLVALGGYLLALLLGQLLAQAYYCTGATKRMMLLGIAGYTLGLVLKVLALVQFGALGLAAATSLSWLLNAALLRLALPLRAPL